MSSFVIRIYSSIDFLASQVQEPVLLTCGYVVENENLSGLLTLYNTEQYSACRWTDSLCVDKRFFFFKYLSTKVVSASLIASVRDLLVVDSDPVHFLDIVL